MKSLKDIHMEEWETTHTDALSCEVLQPELGDNDYPWMYQEFD